MSQDELSIIQEIIAEEMEINPGDITEEMSLEEHMEYYVQQGIDRKEAMKQVAKDRGISKRDVYQELLKRG